MLTNAYLPPPSKLPCHHLHLSQNGVLNLTPTYLLHTRHPIYRFFFEDVPYVFYFIGIKRNVAMIHIKIVSIMYVMAGLYLDINDLFVSNLSQLQAVLALIVL